MGSGLGFHTHQKSKQDLHGFSSRAFGYSTQSLLSSETHHLISLSFAQVLGKIKELKSQNKVSSHNYSLGLALQFPWLDENFITSASLGYCYGAHHMTSFYPQNKKSETHFRNQALSASLACCFPEMFSFFGLYLTPFIQANAVRAEQSKVQETGDFSRKASNQHPLINVTLPVGMHTTWHSETKLPNIWEVQLAYQPAIYRQNPKVLMTLVQSNGSWTTSGTPVARHALHAEGKNSVYLFKHMLVFLDYQVDLASSTITHYVNCGSEIAF
ncbi:autotransporter outer membrane beta-barrel domain-containing protein [Chlamydia felis]|uniref:autotransporter outer membrane beta-barrel domain-containing protein n=1 Tax=Chlamydia felis TaxID=83556 RepID=UPI001E42CC21|nr:autotransporter outer membrane beta-barrel domain-containing protein [Chlamydia felis]